MKNTSLSLRKRKLLDYIQTQHDYITGEQLAFHLRVSSRTIRNDILEINQKLKSSGIQIISKKSFGYKLVVDDPKQLKMLNRSNTSFLSREDRVRHIAFRLSYTDKPINLYDLQDEMFISQTTLEHDLLAFQEKYVNAYPFIKLIRSKNHISFESDERKRRSILILLYVNHWDYNSRGNTFYQYQYLEENMINLIIEELQHFLQVNPLKMDDISIIVLNLLITITCQRVKMGYCLTNKAISVPIDAKLLAATNHLLDIIEDKLSLSLPEFERNEIYVYIYSGQLLDASKLSFGTVSHYFTPAIIRLTDEYLLKVKNIFELDLSGIEDFYITILQYFRYLSLPIHYLNVMEQQVNRVRLDMHIEYEIAYLIQDLSLEFLGRFLNDTELTYLAFCISGALESYNRHLPKLKTVICCHMNLPASWSLKQKLLTHFHDSIDITALIPIHYKDIYPFNDVDLIITTADKTIIADQTCDQLLVSPYFNAHDQSQLDHYIFRKKIDALYHHSLPDIKDLLEEAFWHECIDLDNPIDLIKLLSNDFISNHYVTPDYTQQILDRESQLSFVVKPGLTLMYCLSPSKKTCLSIGTMEHRLKWHSQKIRCVIMAAIHPTHYSLIFKLINTLIYNDFNLEDMRFMKSKSEIISFLLQ